MFVRFWGTRGSIPTPGPQTAIYGGNTSCVEVRTNDGTVIILDCGTGIRELGLHLLKSAEPVSRMYLFIGHTHWDHIQGFPFFTPAFLPKTELNIFAPAGFQKSLEDSLSGQMQYSYFPVKLQDLSSRIHFTELEEGFFHVGNVLVETQYLNHTAPTIAYRITSGDTTLAYVTDHEPYWNSPSPTFHHPGDQRHIEFLRGVDLVIHDAQYSEEEYVTRRGWGHSTVHYATDIALAAGVGRLALFHHDPTHNDETIRGFEQHARDRVAAAGSSLEVFAAAEGMHFEVIGTGLPATISDLSALERKLIHGGRILIVSDNHSDITAIQQVLAEDGLILTTVSSGRLAIEHAVLFSPDLVILNSRLVDGEGAGFIQPIRSSLGKPELPILVLTEGDHPSETLYSAESVAIDYLPNPFSPPMLRSRVRAWLARTMSSLFDTLGSPVENSGSPVRAESSNPLAAPKPEVIASVELFRPLTPDQLEKMLAGCSQKTYPVGETIIRQGEPGHCVYVLLSGRVRIVEAVPDSPVEMFLGELGPGEVFGELSILRALPRSATVIPLVRSSCLMIPEADFLEALHGSSEMAINVGRLLAGRLYEADRLLARYGPDPLTGLPGRRAFNELYKRMAAGVRRRESSVLLIAIDVIDLKAINDRYGYATGDEVLRAISDVLLDACRGTDLVARYGGDEFVALLVEAAADNAAALVERIQQKFRKVVSQRDLPPTAALRIGYAVSETPPETIDELLKIADASLNTRRSGARSNS